jgi:putative ABC transport system permease protein
MNDDLAKNYTAIKNELIQKNIVESVTVASSPSTNIWWHSDVEQWPGKHAGETIEMGTIMVIKRFHCIGFSELCYCVAYCILFLARLAHKL